MQAIRGDLQGRVCMVTGATSGIGRAAARALAGLGAELVLLGRDRGRGEETARWIQRETGNTKVDLLLADLSSQAEVSRAAREFLGAGRPLHVLLNNAGVILRRRSETVDGIESTFAVNHLAYFLLTNLLLERLKQSEPARVVNVASGAHRMARGGIRFDDPGFRDGYSAMRVYGHSKLANILFTRELARRLEGTRVTANCIHPGFVASNFAKNNGPLEALLMTLGRPFARSPERGADTAVWLCASPEVEGRSGGYWFDRRESRPSAAGSNDEDARRLWDLSARMTGLGG